MTSGKFAIWMLEREARALLSRLERLKPTSLTMPMVTAASVSPAAQKAIDFLLAEGRNDLKGYVRRYVKWLRKPEGQRATPSEAQRKFTIIRMRFNSILSQLDLFADVLTQRSEHENGVWIAGLDAIAADALALPDRYYQVPPLVCYLDRGFGAAIRRVRTRLPGGKKNPVAIIRIPRERMIGSGVASSLVHEVGHQGSVLLGLINSLRPVLQDQQHLGGEEQAAWAFWERWISEILADFWSVARVGVASTLGLIGVLSLPRPFVFHLSPGDPHPVPWIRVKLSCAIGNALYPHPQWKRLAGLWEAYYPTAGLDTHKKALITLLEGTIPQFVALLVHHRPKTLGGNTLREAISATDRQPGRLAADYQAWRTVPAKMRTARPCRVIAAIGQARADGKMSPEEEGQILASLLPQWALHRPERLMAFNAPRRRRLAREAAI